MSTQEKGGHGNMSPGMRLSRIVDLVDGIYACHPNDAEHVMAVILEEWRTGVPLPTFIDADSDAEVWAHAASFEELRAIFIAAGRRLVSYRLGRRGRFRMMQRLLDGLRDDERHAILEALREGKDLIDVDQL
ncbi:hypothetical protein [Paracoccus lutimaris]|uniref:hypothetical protein n=1 Tax=Paracoccus lutimaris TaxID=1490030 RepID=UPI0011C04634|nr:hypothetical protein [Paracoccus lutimaris]